VADEGAGTEPDSGWLDRVADGASVAAGGLPTELLGDYLTMLADAATYGRRPERDQIRAVAELGGRAAESGVLAHSCVTLYLSAARLVWAELPAVIRERDSAAVRAAADAVLHVVDEAVAAFTYGYAQAIRVLTRHQESVRRQLVDDLLVGNADLGELAQRVEPFGLDMTGRHQVALAQPDRPLSDLESAATALDRAARNHFGDRDVLVAVKEGAIAAVVPADADDAGTARQPAAGLGQLVLAHLRESRPHREWRVAIGRPHAGAYGIARSYAEARDGLQIFARSDRDRAIVTPDDVLVYRVLLRDQPAIVDLVEAVLGPLATARGGAGPLVSTLAAYFATDCVATRTAQRLGLSVRAITYRLDRIATLTGYDPTSAADRFTVHAATLGAELLGWPEQPLPESGTAG